ncbi:hypothetical protein DOTSEDRAFT_137799 [Dothistroma septosporum NZE10]|uniref:Trimethylguanosine synthase n=1 Tax=Dothistroma septosporum (strain NZE10 / CBS 128990) TaxID=675120 RepID=N1PE17_DOTSN|nr:hypothetical protein DOTSEDRAFT_137799 [Dothistroma septosporum NZE10]
MAAAEEAPEGVHYYEAADEVPQQLVKYWHQRQKIFSKYDQGVWLTDDAWFGVTPEPVAKKIAEQVATAPASKTMLIDAFAGVGGNVIAFALSGRWKQIFAVEKDAKTLACAKHNAKIYGVDKKIFWIHGDIFDQLNGRFKTTGRNAVIFGSPPWGGPSYADWDVFDLSYMEPYSLNRLHDAFSARTTDFVLYLPRTSDVRQIAKHAGRDEKLKVVHYCMHGSSKALCVYYGTFDIETTT